ncbi:MAG: hypothetical protein ABI789_12465 [Usitatibacter sp.]
MTSDSPMAMKARTPGRVLLAGAAWVAVYMAARGVLERTNMDEPARFAVSLMPLFAFFAFVWVVERAVRDADELHRLIQLQALALSFSTTICVLMSLGLFQIVHGARLEFPPLRDWWVLLPLVYVICYAVSCWRYR